MSDLIFKLILNNSNPLVIWPQTSNTISSKISIEAHDWPHSVLSWMYSPCTPDLYPQNYKKLKRKRKENERKKKDNEEWTRKMRLLGVNLNLFPEIAALVHKVSDEWQKGPQI